MDKPQQELQTLLEKMGLDFDEIRMYPDDNTTNLDIITADHAQLFGRHGRTLEALEHVLRVICWRKGIEGYINLDLNSMKKNQHDQVRDQARAAAQKVMDGDESADLPQMNAAWRRIVHVVIRDEFPELQTESIEQHGWKNVRIFKK